MEGFAYGHDLPNEVVYLILERIARISCKHHAKILQVTPAIFRRITSPKFYMDRWENFIYSLPWRLRGAARLVSDWCYDERTCWIRFYPQVRGKWRCDMLGPGREDDGNVPTRLTPGYFFNGGCHYLDLGPEYHSHTHDMQEQAYEVVAGISYPVLLGDQSRSFRYLPRENIWLRSPPNFLPAEQD